MGTETTEEATTKPNVEFIAEPKSVDLQAEH